AYTDLTADGTVPTADVIFEELWLELPPEPDVNSPDTWTKSLTESRQDLALGQGQVSVTRNSTKATFTSPAAALDTLLDLGREIWIEGRQFFISKINDVAGLDFDLDSAYSGATNGGATF